MNSHRPILTELEMLCFARKAKADTQRCDDATGFSADGRFAVADGVTSCGVASGYFAQFLTDHFTVHSTLTEIDQAIASEETFEEWLRNLAPAWQHFVSALFGAYSLEWTERAWTKGEPTGCTFAGIRVVESSVSQPRLNIIVVGDAAVYLINDQGLEKFRQKEQVSPALAGVTNAVQLRFENNSRALARSPLLSHNIPLVNGSYVVLATDAVADWIEAQCAISTSAPTEALRNLLDLRSQTDFEGWLSETRGKLPEDDKAIIILKVPSE